MPDIRKCLRVYPNFHHALLIKLLRGLIAALLTIKKINLKKNVVISVLLLFTANVYCQTYMSRTAFIGFYSKTPLEDIIAENQQAYAVVDVAKKQLAFTVLLKGFEFK